MLESTRLLETELESMLSRLRKINSTILRSNPEQIQKRSLQEEQQSLMLRMIPDIKAKIRRSREIFKELKEEDALFCIRLDRRGATHTCTALSYVLGKDIYWLVSPAIVGAGKTAKDAVAAFEKSAKPVLNKRHGRDVRLKFSSKDAWKKSLELYR